MTETGKWFFLVFLRWITIGKSTVLFKESVESRRAETRGSFTWAWLHCILLRKTPAYNFCSYGFEFFKIIISAVFDQWYRKSTTPSAIIIIVMMTLIYWFLQHFPHHEGGLKTVCQKIKNRHGRHHHHNHY